jgi:hypothetical protein
MQETGAQNAVVGDVPDITELPQTKVSDQDLQNEKNMAKFSKTKEFKVLKEHIEMRIKFFQGHFPNGTSINGGMKQDGTPIPSPTSAEVADYWRVANLVIGEFQAILDAYENAKKVVDDAARAGIV